jgi:hypothetical protein
LGNPFKKGFPKPLLKLYRGYQAKLDTAENGFEVVLYSAGFGAGQREGIDQVRLDQSNLKFWWGVWEETFEKVSPHSIKRP